MIFRSKPDLRHVKKAILGKIFNSVLWRHEIHQSFNSDKNCELSDVFKHFKVIPLTNREEEFIGEFVRIMHLFTQALNVLQNEEEMNIGCVLPIMNLLKKQWRSFPMSKQLSTASLCLMQFWYPLRQDSHTWCEITTLKLPQCQTQILN